MSIALARMTSTPFVQRKKNQDHDPSTTPRCKWDARSLLLLLACPTNPPSPMLHRVLSHFHQPSSPVLVRHPSAYTTFVRSPSRSSLASAASACAVSALRRTWRMGGRAFRGIITIIIIITTTIARASFTQPKIGHHFVPLCFLS